MEKIKWLLVGAGDIANSRVASALYDAADSEIVAICATSKRQVDDLAAKMGINKVYYDFEQALAKTDADSVYIATPHHLHVEMCLDALKADKHVLCEKPLGINGAECLKLLDTVKKNNKITACSNYRLFSNQFQTTYRMIQEGEIGTLLGGWAHDEENYYNPGNTPYLEKLGMSPILGYGFYLINLSQILFGMPSEVFAMMTSFNCNNKPDYDINDLENILLRYPDGRQFAIVLNMTANVSLRHSYQFYGSKGRIYWPECPPHFNSPIFKVTVQNGIEEITDSYSGMTRGLKPNWHLPMIEYFIRSIQTGAQPVCTIESAAKTAVITDAVIRSVETGRLETITWKE